MNVEVALLPLGVHLVKKQLSFHNRLILCFTPAVLFHSTALSRAIWPRGCCADTSKLARSARGLGNSRAGQNIFFLSSIFLLSFLRLKLESTCKRKGFGYGISSPANNKPQQTVKHSCRKKEECYIDVCR